MRVYLAPIIIVAIVFFVSCSTGFRGSIGFIDSPHAAMTGAPNAANA